MVIFHFLLIPRPYCRYRHPQYWADTWTHLTHTYTHLDKVSALPISPSLSIRAPCEVFMRLVITRAEDVFHLKPALLTQPLRENKPLTHSEWVTDKRKSSAIRHPLAVQRLNRRQTRFSLSLTTLYLKHFTSHSHRVTSTLRRKDVWRKHGAGKSWIILTF